MSHRFLLFLLFLGWMPATVAEPPADPADSVTADPAAVELDTVDPFTAHREEPDQPAIHVPAGSLPTSPAHRAVRGGFVSVQVNVDEQGRNIVGDAANEPSIAVDPNDSNRIAIGWRQFDTINSSFRQAGWGYSDDGGTTWSTSVIEPGIFRSDPILDSDADGNFYYNSLSVPDNVFRCDVFRSSDGGATWDGGVDAFGGDKAWMTVDRTGGPGDGHIYSNWNEIFSCCGDTSFTRSTDGGDSYDGPISTPEMPFWGTTAAGPSGNVYVAGRNLAGAWAVAKSTTLSDPMNGPAFDSATIIDLGGTSNSSDGPNPSGLLGQLWVATAPETGPMGDIVYVLGSVNPPGTDPLDVHFVRSEDGGATWSAPVRVNDDTTTGWQWFSTLSVAPNGRLDATWVDTRSDPGGFDSVLYYSSSGDGGVTWTPNIALSEAFDPHLGWPQQNKLGDYYDMVSEDDYVHLAWAATFNGEQDVYYLRLSTGPIFEDGFESGDTSAWTNIVP